MTKNGRKVNPEVIAGFIIGAAVGASGVWLFTSRQLDTEHRQAIKMAGAAQQAQAMGRMDVIRAQMAASHARQEAHQTAQAAKKQNEQYKHEMETHRQTDKKSAPSN